jgi:hypothetical protein
MHDLKRQQQALYSTQFHSILLMNTNHKQNGHSAKKCFVQKGQGVYNQLNWNTVHDNATPAERQDRKANRP